MQADLLEWAPPDPVARFEPRVVQGASLAARLAKAISAALKDYSGSRGQAAQEMSRYLGREIRASSLDAYASESRADHVINVVLFSAPIASTGDRRLLELIAAEHGWVVVERKYLKLIELAALQEREAEIHSRANALRRQARAEGTL